MRAIQAASFLAVWALSVPAHSQYLKLTGVAVGTCDEPHCGGLVVRGAPWTRDQAAEMTHSPKVPYSPLSTQEHAALEALARALLKPSVSQSDETEFGNVPIVDVQNTQHIIAFGELRQAVVGHICTTQTYSLTLPTDETEHYGLVALDCGESGKKTHGTLGVALKAGRPVSMYWGEVPVYAPLKKAERG